MNRHRLLKYFYDVITFLYVALSNNYSFGPWCTPEHISVAIQYYLFRSRNQGDKCQHLLTTKRHGRINNYDGADVTLYIVSYAYTVICKRRSCVTKYYYIVCVSNDNYNRVHRIITVCMNIYTKYDIVQHKNVCVCV